MQFHHHGYVSHDPRLEDARGEGIDRPEEIPEELDVLVVGTGPAGMLLAAQLSQYPETRTRIIERREGRLEIGQADGLQPRSIETFQAFGFAGQLLQEAYRITEQWYWRPDPENRDHIRRAEKSLDSAGVPGSTLTEFPHVICNQARVLDYFAEAAAKGPGRITPDYGWELADLTIEKGAERPVVARLRRTSGTDAADAADESAPVERTVRARYAVGCDGARSRVRKAIGGHLEGDSRNHAWGVMDVLVDTDFPDIRTKCVIQSGEGGNILFIPREGNSLCRIYVDLGDIPADESHAVRETPLEEIIARAQRIFQPYRLDVVDVAWWSVYEVGQRVADTFDDVAPADRGTEHPHVFIAGDACHTHSAKAGQGMNVSMQDTFNLGWKLGAVLTGRADPSLLDTYSLERQVVARRLIEFDREWSTLMGARTLDPARPELGGVDPAEVKAHYDRSEIQASGFGVHYQPSMITSEGEHQDLAAGYPIGKRFWSAPVIRVCDAVPMELGHHARADGRWRVYAFAGPEAPGQGGAIEEWARWVAEDPASPYVSSHVEGTDAGSVLDVKVIWQQDHDLIEPGDVPALFRPRFGPFGVRDEELVHAADPREDIFDLRGIDRSRGAVVVVRPDMYVGTVLPLDQPQLLADYFSAFLLPAGEARVTTLPSRRADVIGSPSPRAASLAVNDAHD
ncbi:3-hydroxybenzoate 4-monooxygenase [Brachybacterium endophyticum]|uniref:3-hydroxybenzoate 4-monooxygenase n=1 Tax=Brachybacterium endophyticum TaxID=2182385 RepID=A0A2U2RMQ1_9MICO|nr:FAD-dependent monooxygenase [Brachybacterium endophyticum]PWH07157.1 3-hydroxybenzoate 4-monooxygenase [Brachybacterium endophyticum]